jgi:hypothetical protein
MSTNYNYSYAKPNTGCPNNFPSETASPFVGKRITLQKRYSDQINELGFALIDDSGDFRGWVTRATQTYAIIGAEYEVSDMEEFEWAAGGGICRRGALRKL